MLGAPPSPRGWHRTGGWRPGLGAGEFRIGRFGGGGGGKGAAGSTSALVEYVPECAGRRRFRFRWWCFEWRRLFGLRGWFCWFCCRRTGFCCKVDRAGSFRAICSIGSVGELINGLLAVVAWRTT